MTNYGSGQGRSFVRSSVLCGQGSSPLWTPALRPFLSVQCAIPGRGVELVGVCGVYSRVGWRKEPGTVGVSSYNIRYF